MTDVVKAFSSENARTWAMPPRPQASEKKFKVILVAGALTIFPSASATAAIPKASVDTRVLAGGWTNSGLIAPLSTEPSFAADVLELRRRSGLTWELLASLFHVDRRSVHLWAAGRPMSAPNATKLARLLGVVRQASEGMMPAGVRTWLLSASASGPSPLDLLRDERFDDLALPANGTGISRPGPVAKSARKARAPRPPDELVEARSDRVHLERARFIRAVPLKPAKPK